MLLGLLVALVIWHWPAGPVWRVETTEKVLGFSRDGSAVLTLLTQEPDEDGEAAVLRYREIATGQLAVPTKLQIKWRGTDSDTRLSEDQKTLLVATVRPFTIDTGETPPDEDDSNDVGPDYLLVDVATGEPRGDYLTEIDHINPGSFSKDGRWLWVYRKANDSDNRMHEIDIRSTSTGEVVLGLRPDERRYPWSCRFSKDGNRVAVLWQPTNPKSDVSQIRLTDVSSGREDRRFDLPAGKWQSIHQWDDRSIILEINVPNGEAGYFRRCHEFDLSSSVLSAGIEKPLLSGYVSNPDANGDGFFDDKPYGQTWWEDGPGWLIYVTTESIPMTNWQATLSRVDSVLGTRLLQRKGDQRLNVRRVNPVSGWTITEIPNISFGWQPRFSGDGRWMAIEVKGGIELWDTLQPRWPWAIGAGMVTALGAVFLRRRFRRVPSNLGGAS